MTFRGKSEPIEPIEFAETDDNETCKHCHGPIYRTQTANGTRWAHCDTKVLFCTAAGAR